MKSKFSYKSKRTIIIAAIITVLLAGTATGVYFFTKGNAQAQAAGDNNTTQEQYGEAPEENKNEQQNNTTENEQNKNEQGETTPNQQEEQETERQEQTTNNNQTTQNEQTTTTTTGEVPNQEYVTEREETVKNPWESLEVGWGPTQFASIASTANLTAKKSNLEIHKTVDKESVKIGDTLTYTISVKNNGDKVAKAIIYDNVPEGTVLLNKDNNEDENTKKLTWRVTVEPGETENVEFTVRVKAEKGTIKNSAIVNGKTTNETETGIINITGKKEVNTLEAKAGDTLTYTITLTNSGNATGTVTVTDEIPAGTTLVEKSITNNGVESNGTITWTDVEVKAGDTVEVSFKVTINSDTKTSVTNKAVIDGNKPTEEVETKIANITGAKSVDKSTAKVGDTLTYTITLTNSGNADGTVTVTDEIPTGTRIKDENTTGYNKETNTMTWSNVEVKAGKSVELTLEVVVKDDTTDTVKNVAKIDNKEIPEKPETKVANITGTKTVDKTEAKVGDTLTYTIALTNNGNADGTVTVTDEIPTGTTLVADSITANGSYNEENKTITWTDVKVEAGKTAEVSFKAIINSDTKTSVTNKAVIDGNKPTEEVETKIANITGAKSVDKSTAKVGDTLTYTITLTNSGNADGTVTVTDEIPTGTRIKDENTTGYNKETNTMTWSNVEVKAGKSVELTLEVVVKDDTTDTVKNVAKIDNKEIPEKPETKVANITGTKTVDKTEAKVGDTLTYTITLTNNGNADGTVTVTDEIPAGTTLVEKSITNNGVESNGTITWTDVEVKAGDTVEVSFKVTINSDTKTSVTNKAVIDGNKPTEEVETKIANITGAKSVDKSTAKVGDTLTYTITLTNSGNADGTVTVTDEIPTGTRIKDENTTGYNKETNTMTWSNVEVKAGKSVELTLEVVVKDDTTDTVKNVAKIDNKEIPEKPETKVANITGTKTVDQTEAKVGDTLTYTITLTNSGNGDGKVTVTDEIPTGTRIKDENTTGYNKETNTMTWSNVEVKAGKSVELTLEVVVEGGVSEITNTAKIDNNEIPDKPNTIVKYYYTIEHYTENLDGESYTKVDEDIIKDVLAGTETSYTAKEDYTGFTFDDDKTENKGAKVPTNNNLVIKLYYTRNINTKYTVEYYYQINGEYKDTTAIKETRTGTTGETVSVTENDKNQLTYNGKKYVFDQEYPKNILSGNIAGNGNLILKLYFKQQFTVRYTDGVENETIFEDKVTSGLNYNDDTPKFGNDPVRIGYEFMKWTPEVEEKVTADATYVAQWQAKKYQYTVNYYYNGKIDPEAGINEEAEYGSEVGYMDKSNGFTFEKVDPSSGKITICEDATKNIINVYYIKEVLSVEKEATNNSVNAGDNIEYTITVRNNGLKETTTTVTDTLPTEIDLSEEGIKIIEDSITSGGKYSEGKIIWDSIKIGAGTLDEKGEMLPAELTLTFTAKLKGNTIGKTVTNTVSLPEGAGEEKDITATAEKTVEEKSIEVVEMTEGKKNTTDSNIVIVMDLSSSMNWSIDNNKQKTAELAKRRLTAAKNATKTFIENFYANGQNANSTVSVVAFNNKAWLLEFKGNKTTATRQNYEDLLEAINKISIGDKPSGYGTYMKKALDKTNEKIFGTNGLATTEQYKNNNNVVIFLSDGKPSEKNRNENIDYSGVNDKATPIKAKGASLYTIGFGPEYATVPNPIKDDSPYGLLKNMSSNGKVYQASDTDTLVKQFTDILAEENQSKTLITGIFEGKKITNGTLKIQMSKELVINEENKLVIKHNDQVIVECSSEANLENYYITYDSATKTLTWNINEYLTLNSNGITELKGNVKFVYYISRNS